MQDCVFALSHANRMADVEEPMTTFWVRKVVDGAGSQAKVTPA